MISVYVIASLLFIIAAKLEYAIQLLVIRLNDEDFVDRKIVRLMQKFRWKIDMISLIGFLFGFGVFNLSYFCYALSASE